LIILELVPFYFLLLSALLIITAAIIQSAIYPFHRWLLSSMTAPTPASALMHAGFVNGSGILLALFSSVVITSGTLTLIFIVGGLTAVIAQFTKLLQVNVKQKLACSTIAQMGFMIMQCGLGFFNAAVVHLILHGFYKAYLFLSSGEEISNNAPRKPLDLKNQCAANWSGIDFWSPRCWIIYLTYWKNQFNQQQYIFNAYRRHYRWTSHLQYC